MGKGKGDEDGDGEGNGIVLYSFTQDLNGSRIN